jgi:hypothetical protein
MGGGCQNESGFLRREMDGNAVKKLLSFFLREKAGMRGSK